MVTSRLGIAPGCRVSLQRNRTLNILQITTHDTGRHFGCYGHPALHTPNIDALAADGVKLNNYFAAAPICCASRASMLTGRYPQSNGLMDLCFGPGCWALRPGEQHVTHILRAAGYRNLLFFFQHEVATHELGRLAFDETRAMSLAGGGLPPCDAVARDAADFLLHEAAGASPFYAQVGFFETHTPFEFGGVQPDESAGVEVPPYLAGDDPIARRDMATFQGAVRKVDEAVGIIVDALRRAGLESDTLVVFTTDHGIEMPRAKWNLYDPGIAIAMILRCPSSNLTGGRQCDLLLSNVDYLPTILELAGVAVPPRVEGRSFAGALLQGDPTPVRDAVFALYQKTCTRCVRTERYKLIRHFDMGADFAKLPVRYDQMLRKRLTGPVELFDLAHDPNEFADLGGRPEYAEVERSLSSMLWDWMESVHDPLLEGLLHVPFYELTMREYRARKQ